MSMCRVISCVVGKSVVNGLGPQQISQPKDLAKGLRSPRVWLGSPVGFDNRISTGQGKQTLGGHKQNLVHTRTQEKGEVTPQETEPDLPVSVQASPVEAWVESGLLLGHRHWMQKSWHKPFWRRSLLLPLLLPTFGLRANYKEGTQPHPTTENWIKGLLGMALPIRARPSQSLPSGNFHSLLSLSIRGQTEWKLQSQKTNQTDSLNHSLVLLTETMSHIL